MTDGIFFLQDGDVVAGADMLADRPARLIPRHVLVTGIGRGGTTAVAMAVEALGFHAESPTSYRETKALRQFIVNSDPAGANDYLRNWPREGRRMFWKDPKIWASAFDPFLEGLPENIGLVFVFRDALGIAARNCRLSSSSLTDNIVAAAQAQYKMSKRLALVKHRNVVMLSYEKLLIDPAMIIDALARFLAVPASLVGKAAEAIKPSPPAYELKFAKSLRKVAAG